MSVAGLDLISGTKCHVQVLLGQKFIMLIKVKTLTGKEIEIDIEPTDRVERIKERVEEKEGIPPPQQRLIFSGKQVGKSRFISFQEILILLLDERRENCCRLQSFWRFCASFGACS